MRHARKVRVFIASDVRVYREAISRLIATEESLALEGAAATVLLAIGGSEIMHFQTWQDKAGNAPPLARAADAAHP
jgi:hypothetical protein